MRRVGVGAKKPENQVEVLQRRISELEQENKQLKTEVKKLKGNGEE